MKLEKELLDHRLDDAFTNLFDEVKSGERFRTVTEAAEHFGVSLSTVSKSVNEGREVAGLKFVRL